MCNLDSVLLLMWHFLDGTKNYENDDENESDNGSSTGID